MSKNYDMIATVDIDIANPIVDDTNFDNLLILGPKPKLSTATAPDVGVYSSLQEVQDAGFAISGDDTDPVGLAAQVAFSQSPRPTKVYIAIRKTVTDKNDNEKSEDITETIARALTMSGWYVLCTAGVDETEYPKIAAYIETQEKLFAYTETAPIKSNGTVAPVVSEIYFRTLGVVGNTKAQQAVSDIPEGNKYINVAFVAKWLAYNSGSETAAFKQLAAVEPSTFTSTQLKLLSDAGLNYFIAVGNRNITMNGKTLAGEWADVIRFRDWLKNDMQVRLVNLFIVNPKVPYIDNGIVLVENQMLASLKSGQAAGGVAPTEYDEDGNSIPGYVTSVPRAASLTAADKASRILRGCKFKARLAGAIHVTEVKGSLTYGL